MTPQWDMQAILSGTHAFVTHAWHGPIPQLYFCLCGPFCAVHKLAASVSHHRLPWTVLILKSDRLYKLIALNMNAIYIWTPFLLFPYFILLVVSLRVSLRPSRAADSHLQIVLLRRIDHGCPTTTAPWQSPTRRDTACQHNHNVAHRDISRYSASISRHTAAKSKSNFGTKPFVWSYPRTHTRRITPCMFVHQYPR